MKTTYFTFILVMLFSVAFGQTKSTDNNFKTNFSETLFDINKTDTIKLYTIQMLGKTAWNDSFNKEKSIYYQKISVGISMQKGLKA